MAVEALAWPSPPTVTDAVDSGQSYNMGCAFTLDVPSPCVGIEWRVPDTVPAPNGGTHAIAIYESAGGTRVAYKEVTPTPGGVEQLLFDAPVDLLAAAEYVAAVYTSHYVYTAGSPAGVTSPSGNIDATSGRLAAYNSGAVTAPVPSDTTALTFYVSPLIGELDSGVTGEVAATLPPLQAASAGIVSGTAAAGVTLPSLMAVVAGTVKGDASVGGVLPSLTLAAAGDVAMSGSVAANLPALAASVSGGSVIPAVISGTLPALRATMRATSPDDSESPLVSIYSGIVAALRTLLAAEGRLRVASSPGANVDASDVIVGPLAFSWNGLCDPDEPDAATFTVFLVTRMDDRAMHNLMRDLPTLIRAVQRVNDATVTDASPTVYPAGTTDLPAYMLSVQMDF